MWRYAFAVLLFFAGLLVVLQVRADRDLLAGSALPSRRLGDLTVLIRRQQEADRMLRDEVGRLAQKLAEYRAAEARGQSLAREMRSELADLRQALGETPVRGPGLVATVATSRQRLAVPQAADVAGVVNELWAAGAEAVAVNGIRVLATDGFAQRGDAIAIARRVVLEPYTIAAIGDPGGLEEALLIRGGVVDGLRGVGITVALTQRSDIVLPAYARTVRFRYARPAGAP